VLLIIAIIRGRSIHDTKTKAQKLVLACAYFDEDGRLMVTQERSLPSEKITNHYVDKVSNAAHIQGFWLIFVSRHGERTSSLGPMQHTYGCLERLETG